jgi:hypothetical protein
VRSQPPGRYTGKQDLSSRGVVLNVHHDGEDELLYPKLIERLPEQA